MVHNVHDERPASTWCVGARGGARARGRAWWCVGARGSAWAWAHMRGGAVCYLLPSGLAELSFAARFQDLIAEHVSPVAKHFGFPDSKIVVLVGTLRVRFVPGGRREKGREGRRQLKECERTTHH